MNAPSLRARYLRWIALAALALLLPVVHPNAYHLDVLTSALIYALLALGLMISSRARTQAEAIQMAMGVMLPSVLLSGYIFPLASLPLPIRAFSQLIPATHYIAISRGIVLRDASFLDLWEHVAALGAISCVLVAASARAFKKTIG